MSKKVKEWLYFLGLIAFVLAIPRIFNYQGKLVDTSGVGLNGTIPITFKLYSSDTGGEPLWTETQNVSVVNGLFSVFLGNVTPFPESLDFSAPYWLEITVSGETMSPRERLVATPYAIRSEYTTRAIQSVFSDSNSTRRTGNFVFRAGPGATLTDDGSNIYITLGTCGGSPGGATPNIYDVLVAGNDAGGRKIINLANPSSPQDVATKSYVDNQSVSSIFGGAGLVPNDTLMGDVTLDVNVDNSTIEVFDDRLRVKPGGITSNEIAPGAVTNEQIATGAIRTVHIADSV
ncbi:MAG: hypothetical protein ACPL6C_04440, partial [bacterium]